MKLTKRALVAAGMSSLVGAGLAGRALAQEGGEGGGGNAKVPRRTATTKILFKSPSGWPNALATSPQGLWVAEQKPRFRTRENYGLTYSDKSTEQIWLMDANGKVLKTLTTEGRNTSGLAVGNGFLWSCALAAGPDDGVYQLDMNTGKTISHRQLPLGYGPDGGGIHGAFWQDPNKLWVFANRFNGLLRMDVKTWTPEFVQPFPSSLAPRYHGVAWDNGSVWAVTGNATGGYSDAKFGLAKFEPNTGKLLEIVDFAPGSCDPHGLVMHNGKLLSCDAGIHPGWKVNDSPTWGSIFEINIA